MSVGCLWKRAAFEALIKKGINAGNIGSSNISQGGLRTKQRLRIKILKIRGLMSLRHAGGRERKGKWENPLAEV